MSLDSGSAFGASVGREPMNNSEKRAFAFDMPAVYRIQILGKLDPRWVTDMCGMTVHHEVGEGRRWLTTITGELVDQAALMGVLNLVYNYGYPLLSLENLRWTNRPDPESC